MDACGDRGMAHYRLAKPTRRRRLCELATRAWLATSTDTRAVGFAASIEGRDRDMEPYFTIMRPPREQKEEFILLTLFNPARRLRRAYDASTPAGNVN